MKKYKIFFVPYLTLAEAHAFKNLAVFSKMNVAGITDSGSQRAMDMYLKCQYVGEINGGRGIVFATGTPISNTMVEMYVMQQFLQKDTLEQLGIYHFDAWAANFGEQTTALELTVEGQRVPVQDKVQQVYESAGADEHFPGDGGHPDKGHAGP